MDPTDIEPDRRRLHGGALGGLLTESAVEPGIRWGDVEIGALLAFRNGVYVHKGTRSGLLRGSQAVRVYVFHSELRETIALFGGEHLFEMRVWERVSSPYLEQTIAVRTDPAPHVVAEHVDGIPLAALLDAPVPPPIALRLTADLLAALSLLADATPFPLVHGNFSPTTVEITLAGTARLVGGAAGRFGSRITEPDERNWLQLASAERLQGDPNCPAENAYSAMLLAFWMLTGRPPRSASTVLEILTDTMRRNTLPPPGAILGRALEAPPRRDCASDVGPPAANPYREAAPRQIEPPVSSALDQLFMRALSPDATRRFAHPRELARELAALPDRVADRAEVAAWVAAAR